MPEYRRNRVPGATYFFTVNLADRRSDLLVREIETLRTAIRAVRQTSPFHIDAWVALPDHMHCIWTLPEGDADCSGRWRACKTRFPNTHLLGARKRRAKTPLGNWISIRIVDYYRYESLCCNVCLVNRSHPSSEISKLSEGTEFMVDPALAEAAKQYVEKLFGCVIPESTMQKAILSAENIIKRWEAKRLPVTEAHALSRTTSGELLAEAYALLATDGEGKAEGICAHRRAG